MKIYSLILIASVMFFTGCGQASKEPTVIFDVEKVHIPTKAPRPKIECSLDTEDDMYDCIVLQKKIIEELTE